MDMAITVHPTGITGPTGGSTTITMATIGRIGSTALVGAVGGSDARAPLTGSVGDVGFRSEADVVPADKNFGSEDVGTHDRRAKLRR